MAILRAFKYMLVTAFHPMHGITMYESDLKAKLARRLIFWMPFLLMLIILYLMVKAKPNAFYDVPFLAWLAIVMIKFGGIMFCYFLAAIAGVVLSFQAQNVLNLLAPMYGLTMLPEFVFLSGSFLWPEFYPYFKFITYIWRATLMVMVVYLIQAESWKKASIVGISGVIPLYFANYNYFEVIDEGY